MKPAERTITYVVYPASYRPGGDRKNAKTLTQARRQAQRYGVGAQIWRNIVTSHNRKAKADRRARVSSCSNFSHFSTLRIL